MPRFVILEHDHPFLHWDLMLEVKNGLRAWRLLKVPGPGVAIPATILSLHRKLYLDYEGPISGDRGKVSRWDKGNYQIISASRSLDDFAKDTGADSLDLVELAMELEGAGADWLDMVEAAMDLEGIKLTINFAGSRLTGQAILSHQSDERWEFRT
jgi:hypothetical protein